MEEHSSLHLGLRSGLLADVPLGRGLLGDNPLGRGLFGDILLGRRQFALVGFVTRIIRGDIAHPDNLGRGRPFT